MDLAVKESQRFRCIVSRIVYCSSRHSWNYNQKLHLVYTYFRLHFIFHNVNIWFWLTKYNPKYIKRLFSKRKTYYWMKRKTMFGKLVSDLYVYMFHSIVQDCIVSNTKCVIFVFRSMLFLEALTVIINFSDIIINQSPNFQCV